MSSNRIKIKLLRVSGLDDPKVALVEKGETFVIESSGVLCYKHHITGEIFNPLTDGVAVYVHPTGDGNLHVPATGTTNNNKVLKAGAVAGTLNWAFVDWNEVTNKPTSFAPPVASASSIGGVKVGTGLQIDAQGALSVTSAGSVDWSGITGKPTTFQPPVASATTLGGVKVGTGLQIDAQGALSVTSAGSVDWSGITGKPTTFQPPVASATTLGGVKVGTGLSVDAEGVLSAALDTSKITALQEFTVQFSGSNPSAVNGLPAGWSASINGSDVTITHSMGKPLKTINYWGYSTSGGLERYRLPSASNEVTIPYANRNSQFTFRITTATSGADTDSTARVVVGF